MRPGGGEALHESGKPGQSRPAVGSDPVAAADLPGADVAEVPAHAGLGYGVAERLQMRDDFGLRTHLRLEQRSAHQGASLGGLVRPAGLCQHNMSRLYQNDR